MRNLHQRCVQSLKPPNLGHLLVVLQRPRKPHVHFIPPKDPDEVGVCSDARTLSTYASTAGSVDRTRVPSLPRGPDGRGLEQFECPYCFHLVETKSSRDWR